MKTYSYPGNIGSLTDAITLAVFKEEPAREIKEMVTKNDMDTPVNRSAIGGATLPVPNNIQETLVHNWNITTGITEEMAGFLGDKAGNSVSANMAKKTLDRSGVHREPNYLQTYEGSMPRNFDCEWIFIPQNSGEAGQIVQMIKSFKEWSSPQPYAASVMVEQPYVWFITFKNPILQDMIRFDAMVCTNFAINYAPGGYSDFFEGGMPKQINISMSFAERKATYREHWEKD